MSETPLWKYEDYNDWSRQMAKDYSKQELERMLFGSSKDLTSATKSHLSAINKTTSMTSNSQRRAQSRNNVTMSYERKYAIENALEIYRYFPEMTKQEDSNITDNGI